MGDDKRVRSEHPDCTPQDPADDAGRPIAVAASGTDHGQSVAEVRDEEVATPPMSADMQRFIGRQLRAVYDDVAKQPVPDRFLELMRQLESKTSAG